MSDPRKHHYLPQFYLRGFSLDRESLFQIEKKTSKFYGGKIKDLAAVRDFHEIDWEGAQDPHALEKHLAEFEATQARSLQSVLDHGLDQGPNRQTLIEFISYMRMRVPAVKRHIYDSKAADAKVQLHLLEKAGQLPKPPEGLEKELSIENMIVEVANWKCLSIMFKMAFNEAATGFVQKMRATLHRAPFGTRFVTSDQPVSLYHPQGSNAGLGVGTSTPGVEISFPLSSRILLELRHESGPDRDRLAFSDEVAEFNRRTLVMASDYVFTGESPESISALLANSDKEFAGFEFEQIDTGDGFLQGHRFRPVGPANNS